MTEINDLRLHSAPQASYLLYNLYICFFIIIGTQLDLSVTFDGDVLRPWWLKHIFFRRVFCVTHLFFVLHKTQFLMPYTFLGHLLFCVENVWGKLNLTVSRSGDVHLR